MHGWGKNSYFRLVIISSSINQAFIFISANLHDENDDVWNVTQCRISVVGRRTVINHQSVL